MAQQRQHRTLQRQVPKLQLYGEELYCRMLDDPSLHEPQKDALKSLVKWFSSDDTKDYTAVVVMPTGTGKTGVICCLPYTMGSIAPDKFDASRPILVIAPGLAILDQLEENLQATRATTGKTFLERVNLLSEEEIDFAGYNVYTVKKTSDVRKLPANKDIILSNSQKWRKTKESKPNYEDLPNNFFSMVIVDEAHHLPATQWESIVKKFREHAKIAFFTATPIRADGKEITTDGAISAQGYAYFLTRDKAIEQKLIREVKQYSEICNTPQPKKFKQESAVPEWEKHAKEVLTIVKERIEEKNEKFPLPGDKKHASIVIAKDKAAAEQIKEMCTGELEFHEDHVAVVHSDKTKEEKPEKVIKDIRDGKFQVVVVVGMLLEGFDYPPFSIAAILTKIQSPVKFAQFIGRIQRLVRQPTTEDNIIGDIITHAYFEQEELIQNYISPCIPEDENEYIDDEMLEEIQKCLVQ